MEQLKLQINNKRKWTLNMKLKPLHKILISIGILILLGILIIVDIADRDIYYSIQVPKEEFETFHFKPLEEKLEAYKTNFGNSKWKFPRETVEKVKLFENKLLIGRITSKTLTEKQKSEILKFLNNPENFNWSETTWQLNEAEYILRFYNKDNKEVGKIWICIDDCGMTKSIPFSPNMKFGGLNKKGRKKIVEILKSINK